MSVKTKLATLFIPAVVTLSACGSQAHAQVDFHELAQLRCAALVAAVERVPTADYLDQRERPGNFTMLRRHKPLYNKCMAVCDGAGAAPVECSTLQQAQGAGVAARFQELLNKSADDSIANARERLRKGQ